MNNIDYLSRLKDTVKKEKKQVILSEILSSIPITVKQLSDDKRDLEILRLSIIAELDAVNLYEQFAEMTSNENIKKVLLDVAKEEKYHIGEFQELLDMLDSESIPATQGGKKETETLIKGK